MGSWQAARARDDAGGRVPVPLPALSLFALAAIALVALIAILPTRHLLPASSLTFLALAVVAAPLARGERRAARGITMRDVAGILAFLGFAAGMLSTPAQVMELFGVAAPSR